jgi:hypothetical protein
MKVMIAFLTILVSAHVLADSANIRPSWSGSWFDPEQSGHGMIVEVLSDANTTSESKRRRTTMKT